MDWKRSLQVFVSGLTSRGLPPALLKLTRLKALLAATLILVAVVSMISPVFLTTRNFLNILEQLSINAIVAAGMTFVIIAAGIDLSVGSILALGSMGTAGLLVSGIPVPGAIVGGLLVGTAAGAVNGVAVAYGRIPAFIMTLGMLNVARGTVMFLTSGNSIVGLPESFLFLGKGRIGPIPVLVLITAAVYLIGHLVLVKTRFGRYTFAIGNDPETARRLGVRVKRHQFLLYALSGGLASFAGILLAARLNSALTPGGDRGRAGRDRGGGHRGDEPVRGTGLHAGDAVGRDLLSDRPQRPEHPGHLGLRAAGGRGRPAHLQRSGRLPLRSMGAAGRELNRLARCQPLSAFPDWEARKVSKADLAPPSRRL